MDTIVLRHEELTRSIIAAFYTVYNELGFGFLESICASALERELRERGHRVCRELSVHVIYNGQRLGMQRLDMVVDDVVIVEVKSTDQLAPHARRQLYNYLHATSIEVGLVLHFGPKPRFLRVYCEHKPDRGTC